MSQLELERVPITVVSFAGVDVAALSDEGFGEQCLPFSLRSCSTRVVTSKEEARAVVCHGRRWAACARLTISWNPECSDHWAVVTGAADGPSPSATIQFDATDAGIAKLESALMECDALSCSTTERPVHIYLVSDDTTARTGGFCSDAPAAEAARAGERVALGDSAVDIAMTVGDVLRSLMRETHIAAAQVTRVCWPTCSCVPLCVHAKDDTLRRSEHSALLLPFKPLLHEEQCVQSWDGSSLHRAENRARTTAGQGVRRGENWEKELIRNPHEQMKKSPAPIDGAVTCVVTGAYDYYHYRVDGFNDDGWGCAYRSLQTIFSWFQYQGFTRKVVPSLVQIQEILSAVDPDKANKKQFVGSKDWIGSFEIMLVLQTAIPGLECTIRRMESGAELDNNPDVQALLLSHFSAERAAPVMIGGSAYAHTILGVHMNQSTMEAQYLILDPHYSSTTTVLKTVFNKQFLAWRRASELFAKEHWYNLCIPRTDAYDPR